MHTHTHALASSTVSSPGDDRNRLAVLATVRGIGRTESFYALLERLHLHTTPLELAKQTAVAILGAIAPHHRNKV